MKSYAPILHDVQTARRVFREMRCSGRLRGAYRLPRGLSIFTAHNYSSPALLEENLDYLGVHGYHVLHKPVPTWSNSLRVRWFLDYLQRECRTPLVLYCDADDVILRDDPARVIDIFESYDCDVLYCSTRFPNGYKNMPAIRSWADEIHAGRYLNGGVFVGRREFLVEVYRTVMQYVTDTDTEGNPDSQAFYRQEHAYAAGFPRGVGCDQAILRFLEPQFHPRLKVDAASRFAWRNDNRTLKDRVLRYLKRRVPEPAKTALKRHVLRLSGRSATEVP